MLRRLWGKVKRSFDSGDIVVFKKDKTNSFYKIDYVDNEYCHLVKTNGIVFGWVKPKYLRLIVASRKIIKRR